jgi:NRPS condensation-like uncharacterized protein
MVSTAKGGFAMKLGFQRLHFRSPGSVIKLLATVNGEVDPERVRQALPKLKKRHPLLGSRVILDVDGQAWYTTEGVPDFELLAYEKRSDFDWLERVSEQDLMPFRMNVGPLTRFILLTSEDEASDLLLYIHHVISDGLSGVYVMQDLLSLIGEPEKELEPLPPPVEVEKNVPVKVELPLLERLAIGVINAAWRRSKIIFSEDDFVKIQEKRYKERDRALLLELTADETSALVARCHEAGVTVNSAFLTALLAAKHAVPELTGVKDEIGFAVGLRDRLTQNPGRGCGFYAGSIVIMARGDPKKNFEHNLAMIHAEAKKKLQRNREPFERLVRIMAIDPDLSDALKFQGYGMCDSPVVKMVIARIDKTSPGFIVTNLGRQDFPERYGDLRVGRVVFLPPTSGGWLMLNLIPASILTTGGCLRAAFPYNERLVSTDIMVKYVDTVKAALTNFIDRNHSAKKLKHAFSHEVDAG